MEISILSVKLDKHGQAHGNDQTNQNTAVEATGNCLQAVSVIPVTPVDELCCNAEKRTSDGNSVTYRLIVKDPTL